MTKYLLLDYGGTIDTNGLHWAVVLRNSYEKFHPDITPELFSKAYSYGERGLAINPLVEPSHTFLDVLRLKVREQFRFLREHGCTMNDDAIEKIASDCNSFAAATVEKTIPILTVLSEKFPLVMVSNFYGNLGTVLETFHIKHFFTHIVESAVVGVRKPDPAIYQYGIDLLKADASECLVVGDSFAKDIVPAKKLGCRACWLKGKGWEDDKPELQEGGYRADIEIRSFADVLNEVNNS